MVPSRIAPIKSMHLHRIIPGTHERIGPQRIGDQDLARVAAVAGQHDEMPDRLAAHVVAFVRFRYVAHRPVKVSGAQARDDGNPALQVFAQQRRLEVAQRSLPPSRRNSSYPRVAICRRFQRRLIRACAASRSRICSRGRSNQVGSNTLKVVGDQRDLVAAMERVIGEEHIERAAVIGHLEITRHLAPETPCPRSDGRSRAGMRRRKYRRRAAARLRTPSPARPVASGRRAIFVLGSHRVHRRCFARCGGWHCGPLRPARAAESDQPTRASCRSRLARSRPSRRVDAATSAARCAARLVVGRVACVGGDLANRFVVLVVYKVVGFEVFRVNGLQYCRRRRPALWAYAS